MGAICAVQPPRSRHLTCPLSPPPLPLQICLETEITNTAALRLYEGLGFIRDKRLPKYYLNGNDAYRLKLWLP